MFRPPFAKTTAIAALTTAVAGLLSAPGGLAAQRGSETVLRAKITQHLEQIEKEAGLPLNKTEVSIQLVDLNGDGTPEALGIVRDSTWCGSGGCTAFALDLSGPVARSIGEFLAVKLEALSSRTNGWRDISQHSRGVGRRLHFRGGQYGGSSAGGEDAAIPAAVQSEAALDGFLGGLLPDCYGSPEFKRFRDTLVERYGHNFDGSRINPGRQIAIPSSIRPRIGRAVAKNKGEFTQVIVPLTGRFRSLIVTGLEFSFGNENGINALAVMFAEPLERVREALGATVAEAARHFKAVADRGEAGGAIEISRVNGRSALVCDRST